MSPKHRPLIKPAYSPHQSAPNKKAHEKKPKKLLVYGLSTLGGSNPDPDGPQIADGFCPPSMQVKPYISVNLSRPRPPLAHPHASDPPRATKPRHSEGKACRTLGPERSTRARSAQFRHRTWDIAKPRACNQDESQWGCSRNPNRSCCGLGRYANSSTLPGIGDQVSL